MLRAGRGDLFTELSRLIKADVPDPQWLPWVNLLPDTLTPTKALIQILGSRREYVRYLDEEHALQVFAKAGDKKIGTEAFRLALYSSPGLVVRVDVDTVKAHRLARPELSFGILEAAVKLSTSEPEALWSGELDDDLTEVASTTDRVFNMDWFIQLLNAEVLPMSNEIAARGAVVLADNAPTAAEQLWDWAARGVQ